MASPAFCCPDQLGLPGAVNHGCLPIGGERKVTRCSGNVIYEIDGMPVLDVLKEYLVGDEIDNWSKAVLSLCMAFKAPEQIKGYDDYLIRFMPTKDDKAGSITIPTEVEEGTSIWMSRRDHEKISAGVDRIGEEIKSTLGNNAPKMVFQFDCIGRGKAVFRDQQKGQILEKLQQKIGPTVPWIGLYTYGEIGPIGGRDYFHNYTAVVLAVY
ncbi:small ligand-binding sensory domain FIST [Bradyrhizobium sp. LB9.1b]